MGLFHNIFGTPISAQPSRTAAPGRGTSGSSLPGLSLPAKGEIIKGSVTDLRYNEVTLLLSDGATLHARLSSATELTIGQETEFLVQDSDDTQLVLKLLADSDPSQAEAAIDLALDNAGIPKSEHAVSIVRSLLSAGLPANKDMIRKMLQASASNREVELTTLTTLLKSNLPVTRTNTSQLQAYRNFEHRLLSQASSLTSLLGSALRYDNTGTDFSAALLSAFFPAPEHQAAPPENGDALLHTLLPDSQHEDLLELVSGLSREYPQDAPLASLSKAPDFTANQLFSVLSAFGQKHPETLSTLWKKEPALPDLLEQVLLSKFVLQPEDLQKEDAVKSFYQELSRTLQKLSSLTEAGGDSSSLKSALETAEKMQDNLDFMNALNQVFPYVQLPLKLTEQLTHGELYVYTKKKDLSDPTKGISILLHLDLNALGSTDIHVALLGQSVTADFFLPDDASAALVSEHMTELTEALAQKGFSLSAKVSTRTAPPESVMDFLGADTAIPMKRFRFDIRA